MIPMRKNKDRLFTSAVVFLSLLIIASGAMLVKNMQSKIYTYEYDAWSLDNSISDRNYGRLLAQTCQNQAAQAKSDEMMEQCYAVAAYYEAAMKQKAYEAAGNQEKADEYAEIMEEKRGQMGIYEGEADRIDQMLADAVK